MARLPRTLGAAVRLERTCELSSPRGQATGSGGEGLLPENPACRENREGVEGKAGLQGLH